VKTERTTTNSRYQVLHIVFQKHALSIAQAHLGSPTPLQPSTSSRGSSLDLDRTRPLQLNPLAASASPAQALARPSHRPVSSARHCASVGHPTPRYVAPRIRSFGGGFSSCVSVLRRPGRLRCCSAPGPSELCAILDPVSCKLHVDYKMTRRHTDADERCGD
jgi:hypothetical protein